MARAVAECQERAVGPQRQAGELIGQTFIELEPMRLDGPAGIRGFEGPDMKPVEITKDVEPVGPGGDLNREEILPERAVAAWGAGTAPRLGS